MQVLAQEFESATSAVTNMRVGWNLGNTLDSNSGATDNMWIEKWSARNPSDYETAWGQPVTTEATIKMFKEAGFNAIRVPVTWYPHMGVQVNDLKWDLSAWSPTQVDAAWMARVKEIVDYVVNNGMYCIINVHHDTGEASTAWMRASVANYNKYKDVYENLWTQIATEFKDYDEHLLFEGYNEMLDTYGSWCFASFAASGQYNAASAADSYKAVNNYAQSFVNAVRATGGNNSYRNLIVNSYGSCCGSGNWNQHLLEPLKYLDRPTDEASNHIIFQLHYYPSIKDLSWAKTECNTMLGAIKTHLQGKAPVIFGEWGTANDVVANMDDYNTQYKQNKVDFARYFVEKCKAAGITTFYWMGLSDRDDRKNLKWTQPDLKDAIIKGYYGDVGYTSIENVSVASPSKPRKQIVNGKVVVVKGEDKYIVDGTRMK
jgi:aryl-phospho-beta-D-glucosidase BglC (GH1 family)